MAHFKENKKDLNLVVGAVLLIAIMVVLSVVIDAWAEKPAKFSQIEELTASSFTLSNGNTIIVVVENNGNVPSGIAEVWINNEKQTFTVNSTDEVIPPKNGIILSIFYAYSNDTNCNFKIVSRRGNAYLFTATVP